MSPDAPGEGYVTAPAPGRGYGYGPPASYGFGPPPPGALTYQAGYGDQSVLPPGLSGWNWGAFWLSWIWAFGNGVTWAGVVGLCATLGLNIFGFVLVDLPLSVYLGIKGTEHSWRRKRWPDEERFRTAQRTWAIWGIVTVLIATPIFALFVWAIFFSSGSTG